MRLSPRLAFVLWSLSLSAVGWSAACSDSSDASTPDADAGPDAPAQEAAPPPVDAGADAPSARDCTADEDPDGIMKHLECTGLYQSFAGKIVAADVKSYAPAVPFWSDGAGKDRFVYLPPGAKIDITSFDEWVFPNGTKLWKEFALEGKRVETRLFEKASDGSWRHTVYRWNDDETDAVRKEVGEKIPPSGSRTTIYEIPNTTQCNMCHDGRKEPVLGFDAVQLGLPGATGVTLATLSADSRLSATPPATSFTLPDDVGNGNAPAAIGWLSSNCGPCHNDNSGAAAMFTKPKFLLRPSALLGGDAGVAPTVQQLSAYTSTVCQTASRSHPDGGTSIDLIEGSDPANSLVSILSGSRSPAGKDPSSAYQMPPLVTRSVDEAGHAKLDAWIKQLPACP